jgi:hypothetical protein
VTRQGWGIGGGIMSQLLRVVRADRRGHRSRLIAQGTLSEIVERAALGQIHSDDLVFGLAERALLARDVAGLARHVPCAEEAALTASLRAGVIGALLLLPIVVAFLAASDLGAILSSVRSAGFDAFELWYSLLVVPLSGAVYALAQRRRLRALRRVGAADDVPRLGRPGS